MIQLKPGTIETVYKILDSTVDPVAFFNELKTNSDGFLLESADIIEKYGRLSTGCVSPSLKISLKNYQFTIRALDRTGEKLLSAVSGDLSFVADLCVEKNCICGSLDSKKEFSDEESRLKAPGLFDILRLIAFKLKPKLTLDIPFCGLFGAISYDAIDYFEDLPGQADDDCPDLEFYYANHIFVIDHIQQKTYLFSNVPVVDESADEDYYAAIEVIKKYEEVFRKTEKYPVPNPPEPRPVTLTVSDEDFERMVVKIKEHISRGDIFQCVLSRTFQTKCDENALDVYARLKAINPGPYMFYFQSGNRVLLGSSPETCLKVSGGQEKTAEIRPIAGTLPRGIVDGEINPELDARYELELLHDKKELSEHCMLLDLARNDIAKVSWPATRVTPQILKVEKFSHVQHLVSTVRGTLRPDLDALHAYAATMNMGTLTGAPKIKAMELIRQYEQDKRGFYGGAVCYLTPGGEFDSCIVIRAVFMENGLASVRAGAGIVHDSHPKREAEETKRKASACLEALGVTV